ncbi:Crp/Fnr family transcriptional regulator [uncultured Polaribacter sp.]|uniref:Crp/Fnr family transcriptional regulator n=1 Tax=uncultured Polaribacter sp. TaxID=174711 RepID=UPI002617B30E|nr:Crp/Fnr family transcriptional regulator [uncultured Polaribacter sp.]
MNELLDYFKKNVSIPAEIENKLNEIIVEKKLVKGEIILADNSLKKEHIFVVSGCLRSFYKTEEGKEYTIQFAIKNWWISDYITLYTNAKSIITIESLTHSKVLILDKNKTDELYKVYPPFEVFQRKNFEKRTATLQKRILGLLTLSAAEKYNQFINDYADFEKIIPNYQIASFLGITPQSLSRIRKEKFKK